MKDTTENGHHHDHCRSMLHDTKYKKIDRERRNIPHNLLVCVLSEKTNAWGQWSGLVEQVPLTIVYQIRHKSDACETNQQSLHAPRDLDWRESNVDAQEKIRAGM